MKSVVLVSGGLDSTTCLALAVARGDQVVALSFAYGQRHAVELQAAERVCAHYGVAEHVVAELALFRQLGGNALTGDVEVPRHASAADLGPGIPVTYVPARNLVFLSYAVGVAEAHGADAIWLGVNAVDYSGYPDCRPEFVAAFQQAAHQATRAGTGGAPLAIEAPLVHRGKGDIVRLGLELGVPHHLTHSCYAPEGDLACGHCDSCLLRLKGFAEAGATDPVAYVEAP